MLTFCNNNVALVDQNDRTLRATLYNADGKLPRAVFLRLINLMSEAVENMQDLELISLTDEMHTLMDEDEEGIEEPPLEI